MPRANLPLIITLLLSLSCARAAERIPPSTRPAEPGGHLPHVQFDARTKQVRVECKAVNVKSPLEFFCVTVNGPVHETVLSTEAKPSDIHAALLAMGLKPGSPVSYSEAMKKWIAPHGPPIHIDVEYEKEGKTVTAPAYRWMRNVKSKKSMPPLTWIFAGSRVMDDGNYAADVTGYIVSVVNFDLTVIDIPNLASNSNELLEWEQDPQMVPPADTKVTMILQPAGAEDTPADDSKNAAADSAPAGVRSILRSGDAATQPGGADDDAISDVHADQKEIEDLLQYWNTAVQPHRRALEEASQAHYDVIRKLRREQQRLIDEADRIQRAIDQLEKEYQNLTTPKPEQEP